MIHSRLLIYLSILPFPVTIFGRLHLKGSIPQGTNPWVLRKSASLLARLPRPCIWFDLTFLLARPLNPVLGELFYGHWPDKEGRGRTTLLVEQVSHHPPITAYVIENKSKGLSLTGHNAQKTSFSSGAIIVKQIGHAILTIDLGGGKKEEILITLPKLRIDGLWYGSPYIELWDKTNIQSSSGWSSVVSPFVVLGSLLASPYSYPKARVQRQGILLGEGPHNQSNGFPAQLFLDHTHDRRTVARPYEGHEDWEDLHRRHHAQGGSHRWPDRGDGGI